MCVCGLAGSVLGERKRRDPVAPLGRQADNWVWKTTWTACNTKPSVIWHVWIAHVVVGGLGGSWRTQKFQGPDWMQTVCRRAGDKPRGTGVLAGGADENGLRRSGRREMAGRTAQPGRKSVDADAVRSEESSHTESCPDRRLLIGSQWLPNPTKASSIPSQPASALPVAASTQQELPLEDSGSTRHVNICKCAMQLSLCGIGKSFGWAVSWQG